MMENRLLEELGRMPHGARMTIRALLAAMIEEYRDELENAEAEKLLRLQGATAALREVMRKLDQTGEH